MFGTILLNTFSLFCGRIHNVMGTEIVVLIITRFTDLNDSDTDSDNWCMGN